MKRPVRSNQQVVTGPGNLQLNTRKRHTSSLSSDTDTNLHSRWFKRSCSFKFYWVAGRTIQ